MRFTNPRTKALQTLTLISAITMSHTWSLASDELSIVAEPGSLPTSSTTESTGAKGILLTIGLGSIASSDIEEDGAAYGLNWTSLDLIWGPVRSSFKAMSFSWDRPGELIEGVNGNDPWGELYQLNIGWTHSGAVSEKLMYEVMLGAVSAFEKELTDSYAGYVAAYGIYALNAKWTLAAGALYSKHRRVSTQFDFMPIVGVMWNQEATSGLSFAVGFPSTDITWRFTEKTSLGLEISSIEGGVYRLADDNRVQQEGFVEFRSATATLRFDTEIRNRVELHLGVSHALNRELRLYDQNGGNRSRYDVEKSIGFAASVSVRF